MSAAGRRRERSAGGVVYRDGPDGRRYLLIRDPYSNWGLPKGHVENGESSLDAACREVSEETGLRALRLEAELPTIDWYFHDGGVRVHKICHFFLFESADGKPSPQRAEGITACEWLGLDEALERITYDNAREVVRAAGSAAPLPPKPSP